jgi:hypothetical protein
MSGLNSPGSDLVLFDGYLCLFKLAEKDLFVARITPIFMFVRSKEPQWVLLSCEMAFTTSSSAPTTVFISFGGSGDMEFRPPELDKRLI